MLYLCVYYDLYEKKEEINLTDPLSKLNSLGTKIKVFHCSFMCAPVLNLIYQVEGWYRSLPPSTEVLRTLHTKRRK